MLTSLLGCSCDGEQTTVSATPIGFATRFYYIGKYLENIVPNMFLLMQIMLLEKEGTREIWKQEAKNTMQGENSWLTPEHKWTPSRVL